VRAIRAATHTGGTIMTVSDDDILQAIGALGRDAAVFAEPAAAAAYAGLQRWVDTGQADPDEHIVVLITGNGLKDVAAAAKATVAPPRIDPTVAELKRALHLR
jgi:threonine synthase